MRDQPRPARHAQAGSAGQGSPVGAGAPKASDEAPKAFDELTEEERNELAVRAQCRLVAKARSHPLEFFDFAARDELTKERIVATPHQRVFFKFVYDHPLSCVRMPPGFAKTTSLVWFGLWSLGVDDDHRSRGAFLAAVESISSKPTWMLAEIIDNIDSIYPEVRVVFPTLKPSMRPNDPWSKKQFTVDRPPGIRDASCTAIGVTAQGLVGSRLAWMYVDDVLTKENTTTKEQRDFTKQWLMQTAKSRLDPLNSRMAVTNVPYDPDDLTSYLEKSTARKGAGWPTLSMNAFGEIRISNAPDWDCEEIRPSSMKEGTFRLVDNDAHGRVYSWPEVKDVLPPDKEAAEVKCDRDDIVPLWPERFSREKLDEIKANDEMSELAFKLNYELDANATLLRRCKPEWIEWSKELAELAGYLRTFDTFNAGPDTAWFTTTGVDIGGLRQGKAADSSAVVTIATLRKRMELQVKDKSGNFIALRPGTKLLVDVKYCKEPSRELIKIVQRRVRALSSFVRVERNSEESLTQWMEDEDAMLPITGHTTGMNKHHIIFGVESIFLAMSKKLFLIPSKGGHVYDEDVERFVRECLEYEPPPSHTPDGVMACWMAFEEARSIWTPAPDTKNAPAPAVIPGLASLGAR